MNRSTQPVLRRCCCRALAAISILIRLLHKKRRRCTGRQYSEPGCRYNIQCQWHDQGRWGPGWHRSRWICRYLHLCQPGFRQHHQFWRGSRQQQRHCQSSTAATLMQREPTASIPSIRSLKVAGVTFGAVKPPALAMISPAMPLVCSIPMQPAARSHFPALPSAPQATPT